MEAWRLVVGLALVLVGLTSAWGANSVVVETRDTYAGAHNVVIGIRIFNTESVCGFVVPLEIRAGPSGSFITSLRLSYGGRLSNLQTGPLSGLVVGVQHAVKDSVCSSGASPAYGDTNRFDGVGSSHTVTASPVGAMFVRARSAGGDLPLGSDPTFATASMFLTVDVDSALGTFEIDTTCMAPNNHLMFAVGYPDAVPADTLTFTKGTITIASCNCPHQGDVAPVGNTNGYIDVFDALQVIKIAFTDGADIQDPRCPNTRGDVIKSGFVDVADVLYIIKTAFTNGPGPQNPCVP